MQSSGTGGALLRRAHEYADGARGRIIMASPDPRALRAYFRLGLDFHPAASAHGTPKVQAPDGLRAGDASDIPFTAEVDRHVRGAAHGADIGAQLEMGNDAADRARSAATRSCARAAACGCSRRSMTKRRRTSCAPRSPAPRARCAIEALTAKQQWAIAVCVDAGLELRLGRGRHVHQRRRRSVHAISAFGSLPVTDLAFRQVTYRP